MKLLAEHIQHIKELLSTPKKVVILTHWSPDGDAMGSSLGLYNFLIKKKHTVTLVTPNAYPSFLFWLPGNKKVINFSDTPKEAKREIAKADVAFFLDFNSLKRIGDLGDIMAKSEALKIMIDHHPQPDEVADYLLHDVKASSTCELIFDFIDLMGEKKKLNKNIANCLYTGIMTDTGSFRFPSASSKTHRIVAELMDAGADNAHIHDLIYDDNTEDKVKLLGYCLAEKLKVLPEYNTAFISLTAEELQLFKYKRGDTEGVVNYALSVKDIRFAAFFVERDGEIKASFRSKGNFNVNLFARTNFEGGGHANAAGGSSDLSLDETVLKFIQLIPQYKEELNS